MCIGFKEISYYKLATGIKALSDKQIIMLDEHAGNKEIADSSKAMHLSFFDYAVWETQHGFTNKRVSLMNKLISFLNNKRSRTKAELKYLRMSPH